MLKCPPITVELSSEAVLRELKAAANPDIARQSVRFFKTGPGEYGESDLFLGLRVPTLRATCKSYQGIDLRHIETLLNSTFHEVRLCAVFMLVDRYKRGSSDIKQEVFDAYQKNIKRINNWDLVDSSAYHIIGPHLEPGNRKLLVELAKSDNLWKRRIAIIATYHYIRNHDFKTTLELAKLLLNDSEDLIHKAVGWMLREVGNRDRAAEDQFLNRHMAKMPRTMLRYAIEKYPESSRQRLLKQR